MSPPSPSQLWEQVCANKHNQYVTLLFESVQKKTLNITVCFKENSSPEGTEMFLSNISFFIFAFLLFFCPFVLLIFAGWLCRHVVRLFSHTLISWTSFTHLAFLEQTEDVFDLLRWCSRFCLPERQKNQKLSHQTLNLNIPDFLK